MEVRCVEVTRPPKVDVLVNPRCFVFFGGSPAVKASETKCFPCHLGFGAHRYRMGGLFETKVELPWARDELAQHPWSPLAIPLSLPSRRALSQPLASAPSVPRFPRKPSRWVKTPRTRRRVRIQRGSKAAAVPVSTGG